MPGRFLYRVKRKLVRTFFHEQWSILVCGLDGSILTHIVPPRGRFWADPFPASQDGKTFIFAEEQTGSGNGRIGYIELYGDMNHSPFVPVLEKPYHLSFPNVFRLEQNGGAEWFMIPESCENETIDLYRCVEFPGKWTHETTLMEGVMAVDSTVFFHGGRWWLFTGIGKDAASLNASLYLFYSETFPSAGWKSHPRNPVVTGAENSRMAGALFFDKSGGVLLRPAQNCLKDYGRETNLNEIVELSPFAYRERLVKTILPEKNLHAVCTHTINYGDSFMLRDIKTRVRR